MLLHIKIKEFKRAYHRRSKSRLRNIIRLLLYGVFNYTSLEVESIASKEGSVMQNRLMLVYDKEKLSHALVDLVGCEQKGTALYFIR